MQPTITARDRTSLLAAALSKVEDADLRGAVDHLGTQPGIPRAVLNAANALRRSRRVAATLVRPPYRTVLPYLATVVADECLARTIEVLGDHSDDPSREQLLEAVDTVRESFSDSHRRRDAGVGGCQRDAGIRPLFRDRHHRRTVRPRPTATGPDSAPRPEADGRG